MKDNYLQKRINPSPREEKLHLLEVGNICPLCGELLVPKNCRKSVKLYEIAHIFPNSPTPKQWAELADVEVLGDNSESFENKIALCLKCHKKQDYHTTKEDYEKLLLKKKAYMMQTALKEVANSQNLDNNIRIIINNLASGKYGSQVDLTLKAVKIADKFEEGDRLLVDKISTYINTYYLDIKEEFKSIDGLNGFSFEALCCEIKATFLKLELDGANKTDIFFALSDWIYNRTGCVDKIASEIVVAFFVQNCEVFHEITQ